APQAPEDVTVSCGTEIPAMVALTATDNCGQEITTEGVDIITPGTCPGTYTVTRTWTFIDSCGNASTATQTIEVIDNVPPTFNEPVPGNISHSCDAVPPAPTLTASDNCGTATVTFNETVVEGACPGSVFVTRTWTATDECGNSTVATQNITVQDVTAPVFTSTPESELHVSCENVPPAEELTAIDNCSEATVTFFESITEGDCPGRYVITRTWTANDLCKNGDQFVQHIYVSDTTGPQLVGELEPVVEAGCEIPPVPQLVFVDNCSTAGKPVFTQEITNETETSYTIIRTWVVADECGNESTFTQTVNVSLTPATVSLGTLNVCDEQDIDLTAQLPMGAPASGTWSETQPSGGLNGTTFSTTGLPAGSYQLQYTAELGVCSYTANLTISIARPINLAAYAACNNANAGTILNLVASLPEGAPENGIWTDVNSSGALEGNSFNASGLNTGEYTIRYTVENGDCPYIADIVVTVDDDCLVAPCEDIVVHNAFTPNGDGINEWFIIEGIDNGECVSSN